MDLDGLVDRRLVNVHGAAGHGIGAAEGVAVGRAAFDSRSAERLAASGEPIILVRPETSTADVAGFALAGAVVKVRRPDALTVDAGKNESRQAMPVAPRPLTAGSPRTARIPVRGGRAAAPRHCVSPRPRLLQNCPIRGFQTTKLNSNPRAARAPAFP